jgi:hypothetical protein
LDELKDIFWVEIGYICDCAGGEVVLSKEHYEYRWVTKEVFLGLESADFLREFVRHM